MLKTASAIAEGVAESMGELASSPAHGDQRVKTQLPAQAATRLLLFPLAFLALCDTLRPETMPFLSLSLNLLYLFIFNILIGRDTGHKIPQFWRSIVPLK